MSPGISLVEHKINSTLLIDLGGIGMVLAKKICLERSCKKEEAVGLVCRPGWELVGVGAVVHRMAWGRGRGMLGWLGVAVAVPACRRPGGLA